MTLTAYTTYADIRATLGVSDQEIEDADLANPVWADRLWADMEDFSADLVTAYAAASDKLPEDRTTAEQKLYVVTRLFACYSVANTLLTALPMFSFSVVGDGKASTERFDRFEDVRTGVVSSLYAMKVRLASALTGVGVEHNHTAARTLATLVRRTGLSRDPVTSAA